MTTCPKCGYPPDSPPEFRVKLKVDLDPEAQAIMDSAKQAAKEVRSWPSWKANFCTCATRPNIDPCQVCNAKEGERCHPSCSETDSNFIREDPRKTALKKGLRQLRPLELRYLMHQIRFGTPILMDRDEEGRANYSNGVYCPLALAGMSEGSKYALTHHPEAERDGLVAWYLTDSLGFTIYNTRGIEGTFYTDNRREDLLTAAKEVLEEKARE